jgi:hypothetical protein
MWPSRVAKFGGVLVVVALTDFPFRHLFISLVALLLCVNYFCRPRVVLSSQLRYSPKEFTFGIRHFSPPQKNFPFCFFPRAKEKLPFE